MIPLAEPNLTGKETEYVADAIASGWVSGGGPYVDRFEDMVAKACGREWCVATITGTAALHTAMTALDFRGGILQTDVTFVAARNVTKMMGNDPVLCERPTNHDCAALRQIDREWPSVSDCAPAVGIKLDNVYTLSCLSFNGNKTVTTGQGGAVLGDDPQLEQYVRDIIVPKEGGKFNYRMANINAAMGCAQMERLDEFLEKKRSIWNKYKSAGVPMLDAGNSRWVALWRTNRLSAVRRLQAMDIAARPFWNVSHVVCLPCSTSLTTEDQDKVIKCVSSL